jgi:Mg-chelatase subunit ChlD
MSVIKNICMLLCVFFPLQFYYSQGPSCDYTVAVSVRDKQGNFIDSLRTADFRGKNANITSVSRRRATRVVILVDISGSMKSEVKHEIERFIVTELIRSSPADVQFAVVGFSSRVVESVNFEHARSEILAAVNRLTNPSGEGKTALQDTELYASGLFSTARAGDSVVVLSDGQDSGSKTSLATLRQTYWSRGIRMFFLGFVDRYLSNQTQSLAEQESLSADTGGTYHRIERPEVKDIVPVIQDIQDGLSNYYLVRLSASESGQKAMPLHLEVVDSSGQRRKNLTLSFPAKIAPMKEACSP